MSAYSREEGAAAPSRSDIRLALHHRHGGVEGPRLGVGPLAEQNRVGQGIALGTTLPVLKLDDRLVQPPGCAPGGGVAHARPRPTEQLEGLDTAFVGDAPLLVPALG